MIYIKPYIAGSASVASLREHITDSRVIRVTNSKFVGNPSKKVVNWGSSRLDPEIEKCNLLNYPSDVRKASNKRRFFDTVKESVSIPEYTDNFEEALNWLEEGNKVVSRETLTGSGGEGVVVLVDQEMWDNYNHDSCQMYVKYIPKKQEYRIHIFNGKVIDVQRKAIRSGSSVESVNFLIRNRANGFIFTRGDSDKVPKDVVVQAIKSIEVLGLDFGSVDVVWNEYRDKAYVLEVNTASGLEGSSVNNYAQAIAEYFGESFNFVDAGGNPSSPSDEDGILTAPSRNPWTVSYEEILTDITPNPERVSQALARERARRREALIQEVINSNQGQVGVATNNYEEPPRPRTIGETRFDPPIEESS